MKVLGKYMGGFNCIKSVAGTYAAFDIEWANVQTYSDKSIEEDRRCLLRLSTSYLVILVRPQNGGFLEPEEANSLIKEIATKDIVQLDDYHLCFDSVWDIRPDCITIRNECDEDFNNIPLEVISV